LIIRVLELRVAENHEHVPKIIGIAHYSVAVGLHSKNL